jgi:RHS repeat-associated protein
VTFTNGRNYDRIYWYDWLSRLEKVEEEYTTDAYAVTTYQYDEVGHLTSFTDAETHTTSHTYASLFGLTRTTYPDSEYEEYTYDNVGNVTAFTDCKGNDTTYTYDDIYRLTQIQYQDQSNVDFTYDLNSNRTKMEDDAPNAKDYVEYTYDYWNRLTSETRHITTSAYTVSYQYDEANRLTKLTYPDSMQILYSYDDLNRTKEIKRYVDGSNDEVLLDQVQYDVDNLITQFDYGNDLQATFSYDARDRISTMDVKNGTTSYLDLDYTLDNNSNITQLANGWRDTTSAWHSATESYSYDGLDRLTSASCTSWSHTYAYDKIGNRTSMNSVTYTINTVNEVTSLSDGTSFTYDSNGNRTQKTKGTDTWVYTYDYANRLTKVEKNSATLEEYVYNGNGKRIQVTDDSKTTTYIYSGLTVLYEETMNSATTYVYGPTGRIAKRTTINQETNTFYYHTDRLRSTRLVTDEAKTIVSTSAYYPFGVVYSKEGSEHRLFTGKEKDSTGLCYYGARYYDSEIGRFVARDQNRGRISQPQSLNRYTYCINNPLRYIDIDGRDYFDPEWAKEWQYENITGYSWNAAMRSLALWLQNVHTKLMSAWGGWIKGHRTTNAHGGTVVGGGAGIAAAKGGAGIYASGILSLAIGAIYNQLSESAEFYNQLWENDTQYRKLVAAADYYLNLYEMGVDCEQELLDAMLKAYVYGLQARYGDDWRAYAQPNVLMAYDWMLMRKKQNSEEELVDGSGGSGGSPPRLEPV